jgi:hypothetical protein
VKIKTTVDTSRLAGQDTIGVTVGKIVNQYKVAKHFELVIGDYAFSFQRKHDSIAAEAALDGIYIIRTSVLATQMDAPDCVRNYKEVVNVERAFRSLKTVDLKVRPIHHRLADRVRAHIFLCMLAYYVEWHMREAWRELMFADPDQEAKATRDPVAPATRSNAARAKIASPLRPTAFAPCWLNSHPSCALLAAHPTPGPTPPPSMSLPVPTRHKSVRSN